MSSTNNENSKNMMSWIKNISFAILMFSLAAWGQGLFTATSAELVIRRLSDCFLIPATILGGIGSMTWIATKGNFDMLAFGAKLFFNMMLHPTQKQESFYEYKMRREEKNPTGKWAWRTLVVGVVCLVLSTVFAIVFEIIV
ncbi:MAG: DUF3899 domain-containing protein [Lachnospiraceae bacterium]|nr:DUF3899 domain-containing protein [Lachnospiraceae bacterium]MBQ9123133.1 DUF3899 domain-containing protein [Lachnospiraceae bacterium]